MKTTFKIINGNLYEYDSNGKVIHSKDSNGDEYWYDYDSKGNLIHSKYSSGDETWREYDSNGNLIHYKDYNGFENWYDSKGNSITKKEFDKLKSGCVGKVVEIAGKKYRLTLV